MRVVPQTKTICIYDYEYVPTTPPMSLPERPLREPAQDRLDRQAGYFRRIAEMNMQAAEIAHSNLHQAHADGEDTHKHTLDLARATRGVITAVDAENDLFAKKAPARAPATDTRRAKLRDALHKVANTEPNPATRNEIRREVDAAVEETLVADPDGETPLHVHLFALADRLHLPLDIAKLPDELIGMPPRVYIRDG